MNRYSKHYIFRSIQLIMLIGFLFMTACSSETQTANLPAEEIQSAEVPEPELSPYQDQINVITEEILNENYKDSQREINLIRFKLDSDSKPRAFFNNLYSFVVFKECMQEGKYGDANNINNRLEVSLLPEELMPLYEEEAAQLPVFYQQWLNEHPPAVIDHKKNLYTEEEFRTYVDSMEKDITNKDFLAARKTKAYLVENKSKWNSNDEIPQELIDTYFAMAWYIDCIRNYNSGLYIQADGCLIGLEHLKGDLPAAIQKQYDEYAESARRESYAQFYSKYEQSKKKKEENKKHTYSGCDDEYNACEYSDAEEFYYWNEDFFIDYEDAEEYWRKHH